MTHRTHAYMRVRLRVRACVHVHLCMRARGRARACMRAHACTIVLDTGDAALNAIADDGVAAKK